MTECCHYCHLDLKSVNSVIMTYYKNNDILKTCFNCFSKNADMDLKMRMDLELNPSFTKECLVCKLEQSDFDNYDPRISIRYRGGGYHSFLLCLRCWTRHIPDKANR